jgi:energy-coupling factor transporter ATP-binding protein EcfA2
MAELNSLDDLLEFCRAATPQTVAKIMPQVQAAIVELALTEIEVDQVFAVLKETTGATLTALRGDFSTFLKANGYTHEQESVGTKLVKLALENSLDLWHDPEGNPWATLRVKGHAEHHPLKTKAIRRYLAHLYYQENKSAPHAQAVQDALGTLEAKAVFDGPEHKTYVRLAEVDGAVYLDLGNEHWQGVKITCDGWLVADDMPVRFRRPRGMSSLPSPVRGGSLTELAGLLNVSLDSRDWKLIVAWLLQALRGAGPYPVLVLTGGQGSGKSTVARMLRALVDPNVSPLRSLSRDERDLFIAAVNGWALAFDNVSGLSQWISDAICKLSTGGGLSTRELFSDSEETLLDALRPVVLNGITDFVNRQDLVDRALQVRLPAIPKDERKPEKMLWRNFDAAQPRILGALLDTAAGGLARLPATTLEELPRLADFALWATACEQPLGWQPGAFMAAYQDAQDDLIKDALEAEPVAVALLTLLTLKNGTDIPNTEWSGTASELLAELTVHAYGDKRPPKGWPGAPHVLSGSLKRIAPALLEQGLEVTQLNRADKKGSKTWLIRTVEENKRQKRQKEYENARNDVQDVVTPSDASSDASSPSDAPSVRSVRQASEEKARQGQRSDASDASDASKPTSSNNSERDTFTAEDWDEV